jgi:hypothetical protein
MSEYLFSDLEELGSVTAKSGFNNERDVAKKFDNWKNDEDAQKWLIIMGYQLKKIEKVRAVILSGYKTDVQVQVTIFMKKAISVENLSVKLVSNPRGYNQIDKRWVDKYVKMWNIPATAVKALKLFTGEIKPTKTGLRDSRRMFLDEMDISMRKSIVEFFTKNKFLVVSDIIKGRDRFSAEWMLVALRKSSKTIEWALKNINHVLNIFGSESVQVTNQGSLRIGRITMQRKGGDAGRPTANMLQFKINPVELFNT